MNIRVGLCVMYLIVMIYSNYFLFVVKYNYILVLEVLIDCNIYLYVLIYKDLKKMENKIV